MHKNKIILFSVLALVLSFALVTICAHLPTKAETNVVNDASLPTWKSTNLRQIVENVVGTSDTNSLSSIQYIHTTRKAAAKLFYNDRVDSDDSCYAVVLHGNFAANNRAFLPPGAKVPVGTTIFLIIRGSDGAITDFGINNLPYTNLSASGTVMSVVP